MKKSVIILTSLLVVFLFSGCANKVYDYSISTDNILTLKSFAKDGQTINLGDFVDNNNESTLMCRLATPVGTAKGSTFISYIKDAFKKELVVSDLLDNDAKTTIGMNLNDIYGSTLFGNAYWKFDVTVNSSNGEKMSVISRYDYESSYLATSACSEMQRSFVPAVQKLIGEIIKNHKFKDLLK
ncbi:hypothetical protein CPU12_07815 [Malaciobacter molluscorum LMG 25693]|uniref:Lipoprotein n=1 Tax=Malaciobacter molluscorum LMG 25693 TaxID=870501 RepID=A0A2G1DHT2_9BACT|nr:hypothetical protein [Malaciobacter molluscorum]AXX93340.1 hypothetical protein AMOL_2398 [Malaciobacter molluscorum LMG 25693]PHO17994.1 hypothetical protein CPU12_07815 [Malaciobacter molluscorum LMG 25693]